MLARSRLIDSLTVFATLCFLAAGVALFAQVRALADATRWVAHTREVLQGVDRTRLAISDSEGFQRAYVLSGDPVYLQRFQQSSREMRKAVGDLTALTADNPNQQQLLSRVAPAVDRRLTNLQGDIDRHRDGLPADLEFVREGTQMSDALRADMMQAAAEEERLLAERLRASDSAERVLLASSIGTALLGLLLLWSLRHVAMRDRARLVEAQESDRAAQDEVRRARDALEQRVQERTRALADANGDLQAFAHTVAHDLRAPLRNIQGFTEALREDEAERLSDDGRLYTQRISLGVMRMDQLITDLLEYSRLGRTELRLQPVSLDTVVQEALGELAQAIEASGARVEVASPLPVVIAHRPTLAQVFANLLGNAVKFVEAGRTPHVTVTAAESGGRVRVFVADNGIGIAPEHRDRIFRAFERLHGQERYPGTGIGLAIVRRGLERMGGTVRVEAGERGGSCFVVELPGALRREPAPDREYALP